jgi:serine/threonine protein kinase
VVIDERGTSRLIDVVTEARRRNMLARMYDQRHKSPLPPERADALKPFVPPEHRKAEIPGRLDGQRADMYAFGVLAYLALTGERPGEGLDVKYPSQKDKRIPKCLDELIMRCLERSTRARTSSAGPLEAELIEGLGRAGFDVFTSGDASKWVRATPWRAAGAPVGEETGHFVNTVKKLADEKKG